MRRFTRQTPTNTPAVIDFGAASDQVARILDPDVYKLRIESARVVQNNENTNIVLDVVEVETGGRVALRSLWVAGPNANVGPFAIENKDIIAQLLALAGKPKKGAPLELIPSLAGLTFEAQLILYRDTRTGCTFNKIGTILFDGGL